jgi:hypothetical protein
MMSVATQIHFTAPEDQCPQPASMQVPHKELTHNERTEDANNTASLPAPELKRADFKVRPGNEANDLAAMSHEPSSDLLLCER